MERTNRRNKKKELNTCTDMAKKRLTVFSDQAFLLMLTPSFSQSGSYQI